MTNPVQSDLLKQDIKCPTCGKALHLEEMLDASVFFGGGAIVFDCIHCNDRVYFAPYTDHVEIGILGCSPVIDPIPMSRSAYPTSFDLATKKEGDILHVQGNNGRRWLIPLYGLWNTRKDIPTPPLAGEKKKSTSSKD